ncbi:MAG TPA: acyl carrier protein [Pseudonocardiaceae bacterium]
MNTDDIRQWLIHHLSTYLDVPTTAIDPAAKLRSYGLTSLYALTLAADLHDTYDLLLEPTVAWDHPTINDIATHISESRTHQAAHKDNGSETSVNTTPTP